MEMVAKAMVGKLEEEARERFSRQLRKELNGVVQGVSGKKRLLERFQDIYNKDLESNKLID